MGNKWRRRDTAIVVSAFLLPIVTLVWTFVVDLDIGNFSPVELDWTFWSCVGTLVSLYKLYLLLGDQIVLYRLRRGWREQLGGLWSLVNVIGLFFAFLVWAFVGFLVGAVPSSPAAAAFAYGLPVGPTSGIAFVFVQGILLGIIVFGLICRRRLAE